MPDQPSLFLSHGSPMLALEPSPGRDFLSGLGQEITARHGRPAAILSASAHWETARPALSTAARPETVPDFYGFPEALYQIRYPAPGAPDMARRAASLLREAGFAVDLAPNQGLDHGSWIPLHLMWPEADIPVAQIAIQQPLGPSHHLRLGQALAPLRQQNVLIIGSGGAVHNVRDAISRRGDATTPDWARDFEAWLCDKALGGDTAALLDYRARAPGAVMAHPRDEHFLPFFVALGAGGPAARATALHRSFSNGSLAMAAFAFA